MLCLQAVAHVQLGLKGAAVHYEQISWKSYTCPLHLPPHAHTHPSPQQSSAASAFCSSDRRQPNARASRGVSPCSLSRSSLVDNQGICLWKVFAATEAWVIYRHCLITREVVSRRGKRTVFLRCVPCVRPISLKPHSL